MRDALAERLLAKVMNWSPEDVARERPDLQAMAAYKYDEYQQFSPGMRFVESLALWLSRFRSAEDRETGYRFVKRRLVFCSAAEINHLVSTAYPDHIRPRLLRMVAREQGINEHHVAKVAASTAFKMRQRQCLFLGLSDGARTDVFRRSNSPEIGHEQMLQTYEISAGRVDKLLEKLTQALDQLHDRLVPESDRKFRTIVLLDDFSASGTSYILKGADGSFGGKIGAFYRSITDPKDPIYRLVDLERTEIIVTLYISTDQARAHLEHHMMEMWAPLNVPTTVLSVHPLNQNICLGPDREDEMNRLLESCYDPSIEDDHSRKGGTDLKYGYARCGLPLVLSHNTPNNSVYLIWAGSPTLQPLFPRVSRHRKEP